jgi:adenylate cyclase
VSASTTTSSWNEKSVFAESSLLGERIVSIVRLAMLGAFGMSRVVTWLIEGRTQKIDGVMVWTVATYATLSVILAIVLHRQSPNPNRARYASIFLTFYDFGFVTIMGLRHDLIEGTSFPDMHAAACATVLCYAVTRFSWLHVALSTALAIVSYLLIESMNGHLQAHSASFVLAAFLALGFLTAWTNVRVRRMFLDLRRRENLSRFLPRQVVDRVLAEGSESLAPVQREVTILFSDLRDFTALSEKMAPRDVLSLLEDFHGDMSRVVRTHGGIVLKFLGDGMLAAWGAPDPDPIHAERALQAALDMQIALEGLNRRRGGTALRMGIGVHSGTAAAGMLGVEQSEYAIIGDAVNLASRVEALTKTRGVPILATATTWKLAGDTFRGDSLGEEIVKGRVEPVTVFAVLGVRQAAS